MPSASIRPATIAVRIIAAGDAAWRDTGADNPIRFLKRADGIRVAGVHPSVAAAAESEANAERESDLLLVVQSTPDEFCRHDFMEILSGFPDSRLVVAYGPWCVSDGRTRNTWSHAVRVPIESATDRLTAEITLLRNSDATAAEILPLTAAREEVFAFDTLRERAGSARKTSGPMLRIAVASGDPVYAQTLAGLVLDAGFESRVINLANELLPDPILFDVLLLDVDPQNTRIVESAEQLRSRHPLARAIGFTYEPTGIAPALQRRLKLSKVVSKLARLNPAWLAAR